MAWLGSPVGHALPDSTKCGGWVRLGAPAGRHARDSSLSRRPGAALQGGATGCLTIESGRYRGNPYHGGRDGVQRRLMHVLVAAAKQLHGHADPQDCGFLRGGPCGVPCVDGAPRPSFRVELGRHNSGRDKAVHQHAEELGAVERVRPVGGPYHMPGISPDFSDEFHFPVLPKRSEQTVFPQLPAICGGKSAAIIDVPYDHQNT
mmetsp:Transcript_35052/g.99363  ORF Transcript_35052/g.99363 Transcript_35052/m.99363 type:complete len:204 (-) Transcript_35052:159-770(-)